MAGELSGFNETRKVCFVFANPLNVVDYIGSLRQQVPLTQSQDIMHAREDGETDVRLLGKLAVCCSWTHGVRGVSETMVCSS